jgi:uncharacterized OsmC-like protein
LEGRVLVIKRIHAHYLLHAPEGVDEPTVQRVHDLHADRCPVARSIRGAIEVSTSFDLMT